jgi:hypothetical protein
MANTNLTTIVDTYGCMSNYQEMKSFFANPTNASGIQDALIKYGTPVANRESYHTGLGFFGTWHDFCDWQNIGKFYQFAKLSVQLPTLKNPQVDCASIPSALTTLNAILSTTGTIKDANVKVALTDAINDKIADYQTFNTQNSCATLLQTTSTNTTMKNLGIYAVAGLALVFGIAFAVRISKK